MARRTTRHRQRAEKAGRRAELFVGLWLILTGYRILAHRFRARTGEIDLIALAPPWQKRTIVFIEVKQRRNEAQAIETVTAASERRIVETSEVWLSKRPHFQNKSYRLRFDVITVIGRWRIRHLKDAFRGW